MAELNKVAVRSTLESLEKGARESAIKAVRLVDMLESIAGELDGEPLSGNVGPSEQPESASPLERICDAQNHVHSSMDEAMQRAEQIRARLFGPRDREAHGARAGLGLGSIAAA